MPFIRFAAFCSLAFLLLCGAPPAAAQSAFGDEAPRGWLGVNLSSRTVPELLPVRDEIGSADEGDPSGPAGALVVGVVRDSPADDAGFRSGDLVLQVDGVRVANAAELIAAVQGRDPDAWVEFSLLRQGEKRMLQARLGRRPDEPRRAEVKEASAGVVLLQVPDQLKTYWGGAEERGVLVGAVDETGPGWRAGLRPGDLVLRVNGHDVGSVSPLRRVFRLGGIGNTIEVEVSRQGAVFTTEVTLEELVPEEEDVEDAED